MFIYVYLFAINKHMLTQINQKTNEGTYMQHKYAYKGTRGFGKPRVGLDAKSFQKRCARLAAERAAKDPGPHFSNVTKV